MYVFVLGLATRLIFHSGNLDLTIHQAPNMSRMIRDLPLVTSGLFLWTILCHLVFLTPLILRL